MILVYMAMSSLAEGQARPSHAPNLRICHDDNVTSGIDISEYQRFEDWNLLKQSGTQFSYIKASEGVTLLNRDFSDQWRGARSSGVARGGYHFFHPRDNPDQQANLFLRTLGTLNDDDLPPMLDWEVSDGVSPAVAVARAKRWLSTVQQATGRVPILYINHGFWNSLGNPQGFEIYPLFIAHYGVGCPMIPPPWSDWSIWQKGDAKVCGCSSR